MISPRSWTCNIYQQKKRKKSRAWIRDNQIAQKMYLSENNRNQLQRQRKVRKRKLPLNKVEVRTKNVDSKESLTMQVSRPTNGPTSKPRDESRMGKESPMYPRELPKHRTGA
ncbi:hypothetical protein X975_01370, partial [Stegodyphus mimosarum]